MIHMLHGNNDVVLVDGDHGLEVQSLWEMFLAEIRDNIGGPVPGSAYYAERLERHLRKLVTDLGLSVPGRVLNPLDVFAAYLASRYGAVRVEHNSHHLAA